MDNRRRSFIRNAGVAVTAAVAGSSASAQAAVAEAQHRLGLLEDSNAITALQQRCFSLLQQRRLAELGELCTHDIPAVHSADLLDARIDASNIEVAADRQSAHATFHVRILLGTPLAGDGTLQQMARLQGQTERQWSEAGVYTARYLKVDTAWKLACMQYRKA